MRDFTRDALSPARLARQGLFDPAGVGRMVDEHLSQTADHSRPIWTLLVLSVWQDEILNGVRPAARACA
jgi:asparagine synthase (glutamine-hydrolysing)